MKIYEHIDNNIITEDLNLSLNSPKELLDHMKQNFKYKYSEKNYRVSSAEELEKKKYGVCQDFTLYQSEFFSKNNYKYWVVFIQHKYYNATHTFNIIEMDGKLFWFEFSFGKYQGIYGPYSNNESVVKDVADKMHDFSNARENKNKPNKYNYKIFDEIPYSSGMDMNQFLGSVGYNFEWGKDNRIKKNTGV